LKNTALLVMDVQPSILSRLEKPEEYLARVQKAVDAAHAHQVPVIYVVVGFRPGIPEISERNKMFSTTLASATAQMIDPKPVLTPVEGDVVVTKRRVSAFTGSDLEVVLRATPGALRHLDERGCPIDHKGSGRQGLQADDFVRPLL